mmetsp:Transcript_878/g.1895  ORF Transcript_878/g.1895 Transcript_878/m.1895 type:complete len:253 (-) Transcript_878:1331-2089(-)
MEMAFVDLSVGCQGLRKDGCGKARPARVCSVRTEGRWRMAAAEEEASEKEPYPGYYRDLERSGVAPKKVGGKKSLYRPDGTPYAPWMIGAVNEEEVEFKPKAPKTDAKGRLAKDPQSQELSGTGLKFKVFGDEEVELSWETSGEEGVEGFLVQRRKGKESSWDTLGDHKSIPSLRSKGPDGGSYKFLDEQAGPGTWIYRVSDVDAQGNRSDLSQCLVEIESSGDQQKQRLALIVFLVLLVALGVLGILIDPQ